MTERTTIALDATYAAQQQPTGIGIYSQQLIAAFGERARAAGADFPRMVLGFRPGPFLRQRGYNGWPRKFSTAVLLDRWITWPRADLFHGLNQRLPETRYRRTVVTLHERFPAPSDEYSTGEFRSHMAARIEDALQRADRIIAVSQSVREHLRSHRPAHAPKIRVVHHGVEPVAPVEKNRTQDFLRQRLALDPKQRYFLSVGAVQVRKNLKNVALALKQLQTGGVQAHLIVAGNDGYGADEIRRFIAHQGLSGQVHFVGHLPPRDLKLLYSGAAALVFPSLEEAFGMPILEAMSCGCPVITSDRSAMPEVAGSAAVLVNPETVAQISKAMRTIAENPQLAADLRERGLRRAAEFSWARCARETWAVYEELL